MANKKNSTKLSGIRQRTHESVDKIMDQAEGIEKSGYEEIAHLKQKAMTLKESMDDYIMKNPKKAILIAAGIGAVTAMLASAMMRRKH